MRDLNPSLILGAAMCSLTLWQQPVCIHVIRTFIVY